MNGSVNSHHSAFGPLSPRRLLGSLSPKHDVSQPAKGHSAATQQSLPRIKQLN